MCQEECGASVGGWPSLHHHSGESKSVIRSLETLRPSHIFRNLQQLKSWKRALNLLGLRQVTYTKTKHFHGLVFRKPCQELQALTAQDVEDQNQFEKLENMFYIPQDFAENGSDAPVDSSLEKLLYSLDRDIVVSDFHELPSLDF